MVKVLSTTSTGETNRAHIVLCRSTVPVQQRKVVIAGVWKRCLTSLINYRKDEL